MPSKYVWRALADIANLNDAGYRCLHLFPFYVTKARSDMPSIIAIPYMEYRI